MYNVINETKLQHPCLFSDLPTDKAGILPSTRYQGSKYKVIKWIDYYTKDLEFDSVLDAFGGTGCVGYMFKKNGKQVFYNDSLKFNYYVGLALIENSQAILEKQDIDLDIQTDLVYIDTPYISAKGVGVNYFDFYHFLEGMVLYDQWGSLIDEKSKHKKIKNGKNEWCNKGEIYQAFERLFHKFRDSIMVISYRDDGTPTVNELVRILEKYRKYIEAKELDYKYVLSNGNSKEVLIIAQ